MAEKHMAQDSAKGSAENNINDLVQKVKGNDAAAFLELLNVYSRTINSLAASFSLPQSENEDLCQEGRMALYRAAMSYDGVRSKFSTYAITCMTNAMISLSKKYHANKGASVEYDEACTGEIDSAESEYIANNLFDMLLNEKQSSLSDYEKTVMSLKLAGYKSGHIAKKLGKSPKSVENTLFRARAKIKGILDK